MAIETLFLSIFDPRSSIVDNVFDCRLPRKITGLAMSLAVFAYATHKGWGGGILIFSYIRRLGSFLGFKI